MLPFSPWKSTTSMPLFAADSKLDYRAVYGKLNITSNSWAVLVDLDNHSYPHKLYNYADIAMASFVVDKANNSTGSVQMGLVTRIDNVSADVTVFNGMRFSSATGDNSLYRDIKYSPSVLRCRVEGGQTPFIVSNIVILNDVTLRTDTLTPSSLGVDVFPAVGDVVLKFTHTSGGAWAGAGACMYHGY